MQFMSAGLIVLYPCLAHNDDEDDDDDDSRVKGQPYGVSDLRP
jgi:hypothetical protein